MGDTSQLPAQLQRDLTRIIAELERQIPDIDVQVRIDDAELSRFLRDTQVQAGDTDRSFATLARTALGLLGSMTKLTAGLGVAAAGLGGITAAAAGAIAALGGIEGITNQAAGSLAVFAAARGVLTVALSGISDAFDALTADAEKFNEAIEGLAPAAQAVAREARAAAPQFLEFRNALQEALFTEIDSEQSARRLVATLAELQPAASSVATQFGNLADGLIDLVTAPRIVADLNQILEATSGILDRAVPKLIDFVDGAITRAAAGTAEFGETAGVLGDAFAAIGEVAADVGRIFGAIGAAAEATGGSIGGPLAMALDLVADVLESDAGQQFLRTLMELGQTIVGTVAPILGTLVAAVAPLVQILASALIPVIEQLEEPLKVLVRALAAGLEPILEQLGPILDIFAQNFALVVETVAPLLPMIGELVGALLPALVPVLMAANAIFAALAPVLVEFISAILPALLPLIAELTPAFEELLVPVTDLAVQIAPALADLLAALAPLIIFVVQAVTQLVPVMTAFQRIALDLASDLIQTLIPAVQAVAALLRGDFSGAIEYAKEFFRRQLDFVVQFFTTLPSRVFAAISQLAPGLQERARDAGERLRAQIREKLDDAVQAVRELPGRARDALGDLGNVLYGAGRALIGGFIAGIKSQLGALKDAASGLLDAAKDFFPHSPAKVGPFSGDGFTDRSGEALVRGLIDGINAMAPDLTRTISQTLATGAAALAPTTLAATAAGPFTMSPVTVGAPTVAVYVGNERLAEFVDYRVQHDRKTTERRAAQGIRR